jgi:hypothetical protein
VASYEIFRHHDLGGIPLSRIGIHGVSILHTTDVSMNQDEGYWDRENKKDKVMYL